VCSSGSNIKCPGGDKLCASTNQCTDLTTDTNCGACDNACPGGQTCQLDGPDGGATAYLCRCPTGRTECLGACVDTVSHPFHCGGCNAKCMTGQVCSGGTCQASCGSGESLCGGACVTTSSDSYNCGGCGIVCPYGTQCSAGACVAICATGSYCRLACTGSLTDPSCCINTDVNKNNCGACGRSCTLTQKCESGVCDCLNATNIIRCPVGTSFTCTDRNTDDNNCGMCGIKCTGGTTCKNGSCI
jgi:hypothetical protein